MTPQIETKRAPVVAVMGHIDHGKSTLLSYIRKNTKGINEAGGITQHISAYEVEHLGENGSVEKITFLDTPGHEAFSAIRRRGANVADIAILVVSAEDGVKPQTIEALKVIKESKTPFVVAITKIDKPEANIEKTKMSLAENEIYVEGFGGNIPAIAVSSKTGEGIPALLDIIILSAELEGLTGNREINAEGIIIESNQDPKKGISATCIIKNGSIRNGQFIVSSKSIAPIRIMENYLGQKINEATFSSPINIIGWDSIPRVGDVFKVYDSKKETEEYALKSVSIISKNEFKDSEKTVPMIIKADTSGTLEAVIYEIEKLNNEKIAVKIVQKGIGDIGENDIKSANSEEKAIIIGFGVKVSGSLILLAERSGITLKTFDIIYKLSEWLKEEMEKMTPKSTEPEILGTAKILKIFSKTKDKQIVGGFVETGEIRLGSQIKVMRRDEEIATGKIRSLQSQKVQVQNVESGKEFGCMIELKIEIIAGDKIVAYSEKIT